VTSPVDLCNMALDQIGAAGQTIQGIAPPVPPDSLAAQVATRNYQTQIDALFRAAHWNSARYQTTLTLLKAAWGTPENPSGALPQPPLGWRYEYAQPLNCLKVRFVIPGTQPPYSGSAPIMTNVGVANSPLISTAMKYTVAIDADAQGNDTKVILTNACKAQCVFTKRIPNPDLWDGLLQSAAIATLGAWFANPLLRNAELLRERVQVAVGIIAQARVSDGDEGTMSMDHLPDWMLIRGVGGGYGWGYGGDGGYFGGWDSITMADGVSY
jgi:hypothetical protein